MVKANNPAGRLYLLLNEACSKPEKNTIQQVWAEIFTLEPDDISSLLVKLGETVRLVEITKESIKNQDIDHALYLRPFVKIQRVFTLSFGHQWVQAKTFLDDATMTGLEHCSELLARKEYEEIIEKEVLEKFQQDVDLLIEQVLKSEMPADLKLLLLQNLRNIRRAILNYRIHGAKGLEQALEGTLGSMQFYSAQFQDTQISGNENKKIIREFINLLEEILSIVANALGISQLVSGAITHLLGS